MGRMELDALLVRGPENITYVIGYETPGYYKYHCVFIPRLGEPIFLVRDFEWLNTPEFAWSGRIAKVYDWDHPPSVTANILHQLGLVAASAVGVEKQCFFYTVEEHETLRRHAGEPVPRCHPHFVGCPHDQIARRDRGDAPLGGAGRQGDAGGLRGHPSREPPATTSMPWSMLRCSSMAGNIWDCRPSCLPASDHACRTRPAEATGCSATMSCISRSPPRSAAIARH